MIRRLLPLLLVLVGCATAQPPEATTVTGLGDSITAQAGPPTQRSDKGWVNWVSLLTDQQLLWVPQAAEGGYTSRQVLQEVLPELLAWDALPDFVVVLAGTNDLSNDFTVEETLANLTSMYDQLALAGVQPVAATLPPNANEAYREGIAQRNDAIRELAERRGLPLVDFHTALAAPQGGYVASLSDDGVHPSPRGARVMAEAVVDVLLPRATGWTPELASSSAESLAPNALMLTDANTDGVPDGWQPVGDRTTSIPSLPEAPEGNWFQIERAGGEGQAVYRSDGIAVDPGGTYSLAFRVDAEAQDGAFTIDVIKEGDWQTRLAGPLYSWTSSVDDAVWYGEFTVPADVTSIQLQVNFQAGVGTLRLGQVTLQEADR